MIKDAIEDYAEEYHGLRYEILSSKRNTEGGLKEDDKSEECDTKELEEIHFLLPGGYTSSRMFGEVLFVDGTYNTNNHALPGIVFSVDDGFGRSRVVQVFLVASEWAETLRSALTFIKIMEAGSFRRQSRSIKIAEKILWSRRNFPVQGFPSADGMK